ncbi:MAG TPA: hypothetical protein VF837_02145 [Patescibacteria group bacterium]
MDDQNQQNQLTGSEGNVSQPSGVPPIMPPSPQSFSSIIPPQVENITPSPEPVSSTVPENLTPAVPEPTTVTVNVAPPAPVNQTENVAPVTPEQSTVTVNVTQPTTSETPLASLPPLPPASVSPFTSLAPEQKPTEEQIKTEEPIKPKKKNKVLPVILGVVAIFLIAGIAGAAYFISNRLSKQTAVAPTAPASQPLAGNCISYTPGSSPAPDQNQLICSPDRSLPPQQVTFPRAGKIRIHTDAMTLSNITMTGPSTININPSSTGGNTEVDVVAGTYNIVAKVTGETANAVGFLPKNSDGTCGRYGNHPAVDSSATALAGFGINDVSGINNFVQCWGDAIQGPEPDDRYGQLAANWDFNDFRVFMGYTAGALSTIPNCLNLTGPATITLGSSAQYTATYAQSASGGLTDGEIFYSTTDANGVDQKNLVAFNPPTKKGIANGQTITGTFTPNAVGKYWIRCRAWNDGISECRPPATVDGAPRFACTGPNYEMLVTVTAPQPQTWNITTVPVCAAGTTPKPSIRMFRIIWPQQGQGPYDFDLTYDASSSAASHTMTIQSKNIVSNQGIYVGLEDSITETAFVPTSITPSVTVIKSGNDPASGDFVNFGTYFNPPTQMVHWYYNRLAAGDYTIKFDVPAAYCQTIVSGPACTQIKAAYLSSGTWIKTDKIENFAKAGDTVRLYATGNSVVTQAHFIVTVTAAGGTKSKVYSDTDIKKEGSDYYVEVPLTDAGSYTFAAEVQ